MYGWGEKYITSLPGGRNSRLDAIQAAALRTKLPHLPAWNSARAERAAWYRELLAGLPLQLPADEAGHVYHLFVLMSDRRDELQHYLRTQGIGSDIHYPLPTHLQPAYQHLGYQPAALPVTEALASRILSLPLYPELRRGEVETVAAAIHACLA
jgi:dTDP-4-amino-4,6-dideoxygalactose transaminase